MKLILEYIKRYKLTYIGVIIVFIIGIIVGSLMIFRTSQDEKSEIKNYIEEGVQLFQENNYNSKDIFLTSFLSDMKFILIIGLLGCTVIAGFTIYAVILYKGILIGYIISIIINIFSVNPGIKYLFILIGVKNILILPVIFLLSTSGVRLHKGIGKKDINLKYEMLRHLLIIIITFAIAIISNYIEAYFLIKLL